MRPITVTVGPLAAPSANNISLSQTPAGAGALLLNGSTAGVLDTQRQVLFTFAADETGHNFVVTGTNNNGDVISETVAGRTAGTKATVLSYKTVTSITISAAATGAMTVGTNGVADSPYVMLDPWALPNTSVQVDVSGTVNYTVNLSNDDPNSFTNAVTPVNMTWIANPDVNQQSQTAATMSFLPFTPIFAKVTLNSQTNPGFVTATFSQSGVVPY